MERIFKLVLAFVFVMFVSACIPGVTVEDPVEFNIVFNSNGGTEVAGLLVEEGRSFLEPTQPIKEGYMFNGWYSDSLLNNNYNFTNAISGDINLYAAWVANEYTMSFESNGGSDVTSIILDYNTAATIPSSPTKEHYTFVDWYEDIEMTIEFDFTSLITRDITLYSQWSVNQYTMSFESNGGTEILDIEQDYNTVVTKPADPEVTSGVFSGWYINSNLTVEYDFSSTLSSDITLYAGWEYRTLTIYFVPSRDAAEILAVTAPLKEMLMTELATLGYIFDEVVIEVSSSYEAAGEALIAGVADVAFLPAGTYAQYSENNEIDVILTALRTGLDKDFDNPEDWNDGLATERVSSIMFPYYRGLIVAGPSPKGRELAAKVNAGTALTWVDVNSANWCVRSSTSSSGYIYPSIWLMDYFDGKGIVDLDSYVQTDGYGTSMAALAAETCDIATIYGDARMDYAARWNESAYSGGFGRSLTVWEEVDVIGVTPGIYNDTISVSNATVDAGLAAALQTAFMNIADTTDGLEVISIYSHMGYQIAEDEDYDYARIANDIFN